MILAAVVRLLTPLIPLHDACREPAFVMKTLARVMFLLSLAAFSGCSWLMGDDGMFRDRGDDYRRAKIEPALQIPETMSGEAIDDRYAIPPISDRATLSEQFVVPRPDPLDSNVDQDAVRINKMGDAQWILVNGSPGQIWPRLRGFLNLNQLSVQRADATAGILETGWLQPVGDNALRERYRLRIEQGVQRGTSEVYVLQADIRAGQDQWPGTSSNHDRETIMVEELAQYLADSSTAAVSMLVQQTLDSAGRVSLRETPEGEPYLNLQLPFSRAWASVGLALEKAGFTVDDLNRDQRIYYLHFIDEDVEEPGFFARLFSAKKDQQGIPYLVYVKEKDSGNVLISIERQDNEKMGRDEELKRLKLIKRHLT